MFEGAVDEGMNSEGKEVGLMSEVTYLDIGRCAVKCRTWPINLMFDVSTSSSAAPTADTLWLL